VNTNNLYINDEQFFKYCEENRLLDDTQIEVLKQAAVNVDHVFLDYFVPVDRVNQLIHYCKNKIDEYIQLGSIAKVECYNDFINMLKCLSIEAEEY
jgi:hypothetical protein